MKSSLNIGATMVADEFIDRYMPDANGEYVKVYLYLLRHREREVPEVELADALNRTESDIRRALAYWKRLGVLAEDGGEGEPDTSACGKEREKTAPLGREAAISSGREETAPLGRGAAIPSGREEAPACRNVTEISGDTRRAGAGNGQTEGSVAETRIPSQRPVYTAEQVKRLGDDEDFTQLLYIAQKYMNKVFTPRECEVFAYLYDGLKMTTELLEYLVEYCVRGGHSSIRYLETVALNWHERGIATVEEARRYTASFSGEAFAVMKAFGLNDRRPGDAEMEMIRRWFREWGFGRELVMEACARTLKATQKPSFPYANRILEDWQKAGVRTMEDVKKLDAAREDRKVRKPQTTGSGNRFHNFEQRDTNYDAIVLDQVKKRLGEK